MNGGPIIRLPTQNKVKFLLQLTTTGFSYQKWCHQPILAPKRLQVCRESFAMVVNQQLKTKVKKHGIHLQDHSLLLCWFLVVL